MMGNLNPFRNVRDEVGQGNDVFTRATKAGLDLAQIGFGTPESAAVLLGKALNDPIKGMTALTRAGVTFSEAQKETIRGLVDTGDLLGAQKIILAEVEAMSEQGQELSENEVEATGETVGEAKWSALRELERRFPGIDKSAVRFAVLSEGERGLLGVGYAPARVIASVSAVPEREAASEEPGSSAAKLRELLEHVCAALGAPIRIEIEEDDESVAARLSGPDLGLVIGKRGQTIDAIQYLATAILFRGSEERKQVTVNAAGIRSTVSSDQSRGTETGAPDRARVDQADTAVAPRPLRR